MSVCPNLDQHTPHPAGYIAHGEWADQMLLTYEQRQCSGCRLWAIWEPKPGVTDPQMPAVVERGCIGIRLHI